MVRFVSRRLLQAAATMFIVVTLAFVLGRLSGSPASLLLTENASRSQIDALNAKLGFDRPFIEQYGHYLVGILHGDFGDSYRQQGVSSMSLVLERLPSSLELGAVGFAVGIVLAFVAVLSVHLCRSNRLRSLFLTLGSFRQAIPDFFFGLLLVMVFAVWLGVLPSLGSGTALSLVLPALTVGSGQFVVYTRLLDNALNEQRTLDYPRTALARGETNRYIVIRELLPNALLPVLTMAGISLGTFLGGLVIVENVFAWPGLGQLMLNAVYSRDFPVVQSGLIVVAAIFIGANLLVDLIYGLIDPRVRLS